MANVTLELIQVYLTFISESKSSKLGMILEGFHTNGVIGTESETKTMNWKVSKVIAELYLLHEGPRTSDRKLASSHWLKAALAWKQGSDMKLRDLFYKNHTDSSQGTLVEKLREYLVHYS